MSEAKQNMETLSAELVVKLRQIRGLKEFLRADKLTILGEEISPIPSALKLKMQQRIAALEDDVDSLVQQLKG